ncbi:MAG TPA: hypothetical protein VHX38_31755 [Pseudonocardiaceae bacterium]|jgi:hypothetical protein|nr:hypothetical protein [Pseudonocardiaceae bacterium]
MTDAPNIPEFPNLRGTFGTSLPVVTALMAAISTALFVVPVVDTTKQATLGYLPWTPDQISVVSGSLATVLFIAATLASLFAHAKAIDQVPPDVLVKMLPGDGERHKETLRNDGDRYYRYSRFFWVNGTSTFVLTIGAVAYVRVPPELLAAAILAVLIALFNISDKELRRPNYGAASIAVILGCIAVGLATII